MMNLLSQIIQKGGNQGLNVKEATTPTSSTSEAQEKNSKFSQLVIGMLGMNSQNSEGAKTLKDGAKTKGGDQEQSNFIEDNQAAKANSEVSFGLFIGQSISLAKNMIGTQAVAEQSASQKHGEPSKNHNTDGEQKAVPKILLSGVDGSEARKQLSDNVKVVKDGASTLTRRGAQKNMHSSNLVLSGAKGEASQKGKGSSTMPKTGAQSNGNATALKLTLKKMGPQAGTVQNGPFKVSSVDSVQSILSTIKKGGEIQLEMGQNKNEQQKAFVKAISTTQKGMGAASKQMKPVQNDPALKHLIQQATDNEHKTVLKESQLPSSGVTKGEAAKTSSGRSLNINTNLVQSLAATQQDKMLFRPLQQSSTSFELDPSKLMKIESSNTQELEMELQAQTDRDTSSGDDGKSSLKLNGVTVSQMSRSSGRREFSVQLVRHLQQQSETAKSGSSQRWSHHRLVMDDGQALNVSVRQAEGAMHLQLSAGNSELNKIIQQHIDEIRQHLQEQMNVEVNLQFQHFGNQQTGSESNQSAAQQELNGGFSQENRGGSAQEATSGRTTRYLGFNNNEWTA